MKKFRKLLVFSAYFCNMRHIIVFIFISFFFARNISAQIIGSGAVHLNELRGYVVTDSTGMNCIPFAHVFFIHKNDTVPLVANSWGMFSYKGQIIDSMRIRVTAVGYKTFEGDYFPKKHGFYIKILMEQEEIALNEIIVQGKTIAMVIKGDTLQYNADAFITLEGDFMDMLLKKIPGVTLSPGGGITVNGERIAKIYVNGDHKLFETPEEAIQKIEADNVKDIKVYEETREEDKKMGLKYGKKETVMNVTTKKEVKKDWKNSNISIGGGVDFANNRSQKYNDKYDLKMSYNSRLAKRSINMDAYYSNWYPVLSIDRKKFGGSFMYSNSWKSIEQLSVRLEYGNGTIYDHLLEQYTYFPTEEYESRNFTNSKKNRDQDENLQMSFNTKIRTKSGILSLQSHYKYTDEKVKRDEFSLAMMNEEQMNHSYVTDIQKKYHSTFLTSFAYTHYLPNKYRINISGDYGYSGENGYGSRQDTLQESSKHIHLDQTINNKDNSMNFLIRLSKSLGSLFQISIGGAYDYDKQTAQGIAIDNLTGLLDSVNTQDYSLLYENAIGEISFNYMGKKFTLYLTGSLKNTRRKHIENFPNHHQTHEDFLRITSDINSHFKFSPASRMSMSYSLSSQLPSVEETRSVINDVNPLSLRVGNSNIKLPRVHKIEYSFKQTFVSISSALNLRLNYLITEDYITQNSQYFTKDTYLSKYNYTAMRGATLYSVKNSGTFHQFKGNVNYSALSDLLKAKLTFSLEYLYEHKPSFSQELSNIWKRNEGLFTLNFISNFSRKIELSFNSKTSISRNKSAISKASDIFKEQISFNLRTIIIPKYTLKASFLYNYDRRCSDGIETNGKNLTASISRQLGKNINCSLDGYNLLDNQGSKSLDKTAEYLVYREFTFTGRCIMATLKYSF